MISHFDLPEAPLKRPVIIGAGNAGLALAARLANHQIHCILVEKQSEVGGQLLLSGGAFSGAGSNRQKKRGIEDQPELHYQEVLKISHGLANKDLVALATKYAANAIDWLEELGFDFEPSTPAIVLGHEPYSKPRTYWGTHPVNGARAILDVFLPALESGYIDLRTSTECVGINFTQSDPTIGVESVTVSQSGHQQEIPADMVIFATGGYSANRELLSKYQPGYEVALLGCLPHATGDGHQLLEALGVPIVGGEYYLPTMGMIEDSLNKGVALKLSEARVIVDANFRKPWEIWVNKNGERWVDETVLSPDTRERALLQQPDLTWWSVWDEGTMNASPTTPIAPEWNITDIKKAVNAGESWIICAETVEELSQKMGVPAENLKETIRTYNSQTDDRFQRDFFPTKLENGPFYAAKSTGAMLLSRGGPTVDRFLRPMRSDGKSIVGVHAIGEILGMSQFSGDAFAGGMSVGPALTFGVVIADAIANKMSTSRKISVK